MRAKQLITKYPFEWVTIEASVWDDMRYQAKRLKLVFNSALAKVVSYNAAFMATSLLHDAKKKK